MFPSSTAKSRPSAGSSLTRTVREGFYERIIDVSNQSQRQHASSYCPYPTYSTYQPSTITFVETKAESKQTRSKSRPKSKSEKPTRIREAPPEYAKNTSPKKISIKGRRAPPPPRRLVVEKLPAEPVRPPKVYIDRWLPVPLAKQRITVKKAAQSQPAEEPKNLVVEWTVAEPKITQRVI